MALAELSKTTRELNAYYLAHPWAFAIGDDVVPPILGPQVMLKAAGQPVVGFSKDQKKYLRAYCDVLKPRLIAKTGRGCSKTFCAAVGCACLAWCLPSFTCTVNSGSMDQGNILYRYWEAFCEAEAMRDPLGPVLSDPIRSVTFLRNGGDLRIMSASEKMAKGPHPNMVVLDEACATEERIMELVEGQLVGAPAPAGGRGPLYRLQSTPDKLFHLFRDTWIEWEEKQKQGDRDYVCLEWGARDCPWITDEEIDRLEAEKDANWCKIHIYGQFGSATGTVFDYRLLQEATVPKLGDTTDWMKGDVDVVWQAVVNDPDRVAKAALGIDWGWEHPTVMVVVALVESEEGPRLYVVHVEGHSHMKEVDQMERIAQVASLWRAHAFMDANDPRLNAATRATMRRVKRRSTPVAFGKWNMGMIGAVNEALEHRRLVLPLEGEGAILLRQLSDYSWAEGPIEKPKKENDDYVDAIKLAVWGLKQKSKPGVSRMRRRPPHPELRGA